jgi:class 3 adenylate cyclase/tetratricopeptide (TPR) repeat protein
MYRRALAPYTRAMAGCPRCGAAVADSSRFCATCGTPLGTSLRPRQEVRKTVTVLFCDVVDSTVLGESVDPETVRHAMSRYFDEMKTIVERHGGVVERFRGDEVMAVFGVPTVHEDDALRAVRTGMAMQRRLEELNAELRSTWGVVLECRIGINTGEVVAGDPGTGATFVTGDAVNLAKRLEQAASAGEILVGTATYPLVKDAVKVGPRERFSVKGKREPVSPFRLHDVDTTAAGVARRLDARLVNREIELSLLHAAADASEQEPPCRLLTVVGPAGIGKSRLVAELIDQLDGRFRSLRGRCLPYGEAITFWPVRDIVREAGGEEALTMLLAGVDDGIRIAELIRNAVGQPAGAAAAEETFWAIRRFLEVLARDRPLAVCFDDVHWAAPTLLDLIEYLAGWIRDAPILLLVLARTDLLELRPTWAAPRPNATLLPLEPLSDVESGLLLERLGEGIELPTTTRERIVSAAEGNPLFVEQMVAMAAEADDSSELRMPPTIQALLAERLDRLSMPERMLLERASVIGKEFIYRAVIELSPEDARADAGTHLFSLIRKELVRPVRSDARDDVLAFRHDLIRATAYDAVPKALRAELHERFAGWVEANFAERIHELEEIVGYHLEQAYRYLAELRVADEHALGLAKRAALRLGSAGRRAEARGDGRSASNLLRRAVVLPGTSERRRIEWQLDLATALRESGELGAAASALDAAADEAAGTADERLEARAEVERSFLQMYTDPVGWPAQAEDVARAAIAVLERHGDDFGLARAWTVVALANYVRCHISTMEELLESALDHASRAGDGRQVSTILNAMARAALVGPTQVDAAIARCSSIAARRPHDKALEADLASVRAVLEAMAGRFDAARTLYRQSHEVHEDLGMSRPLASSRAYSGEVELLAGDSEAAERELRAGSSALEAIGDTFNLSTVAALLGEALRRQGRLDEGWTYTSISERTSSPLDVISEVGWRVTRARIANDRGASEEARGLVTAAITRARATDNVNLLAGALVALSEIHGVDENRRTAALQEALALYEAKGNAASAAVTREAMVQSALPT